MPQHPTIGIVGIKPRKQLSGERLDRQENEQLSREYIQNRNGRLKLAIQKEEVELAEKRGSLISVKLAQRQASFLVMAARQKLLALPIRCAPKLAAESNLHKCQQILQAEILSVLDELRQLPEAVQPGWQSVEEEKDSKG